MDFMITDKELDALCGLPHLQQLTYLRGIRPYMDVKTGVVGIKRGISHQSIAEQLYVEPQQGIKSSNYSRMQIRRAISGLVRAGLISMQSQKLKLILNCNLASRGYSVQNKPDLNPTYQADTRSISQPVEIKEIYPSKLEKPDTVKMPKADAPLKDNNYIYLLSQFEQFWSRYPEKKSRHSAQAAFQQLNPDNALVNKIMRAIDAQIKSRVENQVHGSWLPPWKYPSNWLTQQCWEDELTCNTNTTPENKHANRKKNTRSEPKKDMFWGGVESDAEPSKNNVVQFIRH